MQVTQCAIITAYKEPDELGELLKALHGDMSCYVHIDLKAEDQFTQVKMAFPDVHFFSKYSINWGG